jgi:hypothetical protein
VTDATCGPLGAGGAAAGSRVIVTRLPEASGFSAITARRPAKLPARVVWPEAVTQTR